MRSTFFYLFFLLVASSCGSSRSLVYFKDLEKSPNYTEEVKNKVNPKIQPDDLLTITVSSLNPESNVLFNNGVLQTIGGTSSGVATGRTNEGYLVDKDGSINFPVLGNVKLGGLTKEEATSKMVAEISKSVKNPIVNIKLINFRITVLGEVNRPSTFIVPSERVNLLEAIGLAGDLTAYGKRENVLIIRETNSIRSTFRINLTSKEALNSPSFYLQQNDVVYVEPAKIKSLQSGDSSFYIPLVSLGISVITALIFLTR
ncbi:polysaccharide biosynthesis/export family protein [Hymenobacter norwichensis]|uniref:polysaccharide biosynthesis/export family protein n=1 Tax=Hymenobacter norwichensis TaxID=223903 RepID=UPI0003B3B423|nr:polysaccharide biosynthesis/export family protein [Hymenobacter norwichensis]